MTTLVILLNPRARIGADAAAVPASGAAGGAELFYVLTENGLAPSRHGRAAPALLPQADSAVVVVPEQDVSWHRLVLPKAPPTKLRAAIAGALEERVLDEPERLHFAIAPNASAGQPTWIAGVDKAWLKAELSALDKAGVAVERAVPMAWPEDTPLGHFGAPHGDDASAPMQLTWSDANGVVCMGVHGALARQMLSQWSAQPARWTSHPAVAAPAERWLGSSVLVLTDEQRLLQAMRSLWNLLQFDLAAKHRGAVALRDAMRRWKSASWRPVRWGVAALVALQVAGLNLYAWHQERQIVAKREAMTALLRATHPQVRNVLDAPAQMQRETELLRAAAGRVGDSDLETLLGVAASAWPDGLPPLSMLRFDNGRLSFSGTGWSAQQVEQFRTQLNAGGIGEWSVTHEGPTVTLSRAAVKAAS
jgi:general secretion pathway protein L